MKKIIVLAIVCVLAWYGYGKVHRVTPPETEIIAPAVRAPAATATEHYRCDGRTHCSQMRSCEEAIYFIRNCPSTKMDGDGDGIPCERQWCS